MAVREEGGARARRDVALASLESTGEYLGAVRRCTASTAALFREQRVREAGEQYAHLLDALGVVLFSLRAAGSELGAEGAALASVEAEMHELSEVLIDAQERQDWLAVADGLERDLDRVLADWRDRARSVREAAARSGGSHESD